MDRSADTTKLKKNLGLPQKLVAPFLTEGTIARRIVAAAFYGFHPFLRLIMTLYAQIPRELRHYTVRGAWAFWVALHRYLPASLVQRGMSKTLSAETHALTNILWGARLFPTTVPIVRFGLGQMDANYPATRFLKKEIINNPETGVRGTYLHLTPESKPKPKVIFWFYGGAFIGGDVEGNTGLAERYARKLGCDVFLVDLRLSPEYMVTDIIKDGCRAYEWLLTRTDASNILCLGISSGGGAVVRTLQLALASAEERRGYYITDKKLPMPAGAVLCSPFVDYTEKGLEGMRENCQYDLIVSQSILEWAFPNGHCLGGDDEQRVWLSPLYQSMEGLCPLFVSTSTHEACWNEDSKLAELGKKAGVEVHLQNKPYQCHVYQIMAAFTPEAVEAEAEIVAWMKEKFA